MGEGRSDDGPSLGPGRAHPSMEPPVDWRATSSGACWGKARAGVTAATANSNDEKSMVMLVLDRNE